MSAPVVSSCGLCHYRSLAKGSLHPGSHIYVGLRGGGGVYHIINLSTLILFAPTFILISLSQASFVASLKQHIVLVVISGYVTSVPSQNQNKELFVDLDYQRLHEISQHMLFSGY